MKALLVDGYVDEPAVLGVPPYVSPYIRYTYGALLLKGYDVDYLLVDDLRKIPSWRFDHDLIVIFGGTTVPGHYLSASPILLSEIKRLVEENRDKEIFLGGPVSRAYTIKGGSKAVKVELEGVRVARRSLWGLLLKGEDLESYDVVRDVALAGSELVSKHSRFPNVICEIEVSRGCERSSFCSFCTEPVLHGRLHSRSVKDVVEEVGSLYEKGCKAFRLGRTANILAYMADRNSFKPAPVAIEELYSGIREVAPDLEVLHTDNANPSFITRYEREVRKIIETIVMYNTPGDVLSFGVESFDPKVLRLTTWSPPQRKFSKP